jgi:salicylate hydroxylase
MSSTTAIVGGGIGGLTAAGCLHKAGLNVTVYEQAAELKEVGAGVVVSLDAMRLLRRLHVLMPAGLQPLGPHGKFSSTA